MLLLSSPAGSGIINIWQHRMTFSKPWIFCSIQFFVWWIFLEILVVVQFNGRLYLVKLFYFIYSFSLLYVFLAYTRLYINFRIENLLCITKCYRGCSNFLFYRQQMFKMSLFIHSNLHNYIVRILIKSIIWILESFRVIY